jgi:hypothetical protein
MTRVHESNDMTDTAQLKIFIRVIHSKYYVHEDAASYEARTALQLAKIRS